MNGRTGIQWIQGSEEKSDRRKAGREGKAALYSDIDCKRTLRETNMGLGSIETVKISMGSKG
jgi:hypothetical protein